MNYYLKTFTIQTTSELLYSALTTKNGLSNWWTPTCEIFPQIGGIATFRFNNEYIVMKIAKLVPQTEVLWKCVEHSKHAFGSSGENAWVGTTVKFTITLSKTELQLDVSHMGLSPELPGFTEASKAWDAVLNSLQLYLETGKGLPFTHNASKIH